jgi:hypothetical protein
VQHSANQGGEVTIFSPFWLKIVSFRTQRTILA